MGFKLGKNRGNYAVNGIIKTKMRFGPEGILGEANMDGTIYINENIQQGSEEERQVINHEMRHATDMKLGKLAYGDDFVMYNGRVYPRRTINGKDMIIVDGVAKEAGDEGFPWEEDANNGNETGTIQW